MVAERGSDLVRTAPSGPSDIPALGFLVFTSMIVLSRSLGPRPGQEGTELPTLIGGGVLFVFIQLLHFWLIEKTLGRNDN